MNINDVLKPQEVGVAYDRLVKATQQTRELQQTKKVLLQDLAVKKADLVSDMQVDDPKWNFGKNENERDVTTRIHFQRETKDIDLNEIALMENAEEISLARIEVDRVKTLIAYFQALGVE